ncbi:MAG: PHB depolymerase family esterase [Polyangiaceae bacterium]|nr:PHB depolymerase family esterase [Polyangiaceae bacterium]
MNRHYGLSIAPISFGLLVAAPAHAASMTQVNRSTWAGSASLPSYAQMYVYVPDKLADNPAIVVSAHSCGNSAEGQFGAITKTRAKADQNGFIIILPDNPGQNCWDVGSKQALTHDGGGDTHAVAQMVRYALTQYSGDPKRVYVFGGSSGAMMTQALLGVYPELFTAGAARAGVPCGCWAESYDAGQQWSGPCAGGSVSKTAQQWGDLVRAINSNYTGHRPRVQLYHGESDTTISYKNMGEAIKEWTNVLELSENPTSTETVNSSGYTYNRRMWENDCGYVVLDAWSAPGQGHSMSYEEDAILEFFGLDTAGDSDPELAACSGTGGAGTGGASGTGGTTATGGAGGTAGGVGGATGGGGGVVGPTGGRSSVGGRSSAGGTTATGGTSADGRGGRSATGGTPTTGGIPATTGGTGPAGGGADSGGSPVSSGGTSTTGGISATGGALTAGGTYATGGISAPVNGGTVAAGGGGASAASGSSAIPGTQDDTASEGCGCRLGRHAPGFAGATALLAALLGVVVRRRKRRPRC